MYDFIKGWLNDGLLLSSGNSKTNVAIDFVNFITILANKVLFEMKPF